MSDYCECTICGSDKALTGTKLCNGCWEVTRRLEMFLREVPKAVEVVCQALAEQDPRFECLRNLLAGEPIFILRAKDQLAAPVVQAWAESAGRHFVPSEKIGKARQVVRDMLAWARTHGSKVPD